MNSYLPPLDHNHLTHPKYRPDIDGLRAVAVLSVVGFHAFPEWIKGGFIGVDIFFVISGYLISTIIFDSLLHKRFSFFEFYSRRIKRIFPALLLVLISCFVFGWFALLADEYKQLGKHIAGGAGFVSNFIFWNESGYFDNAADTKPLLHLWSLGIEEQFYIFWPLLLWLASKTRFNYLTITLVVMLISFCLNISKAAEDVVATFYSPQTRFWELLVGSVLAYVTLCTDGVHTWRSNTGLISGWVKIVYTRLPEPDGKTLRNAQALIGAGLIMTGILVITKENHFTGLGALLPTLGAVLLILAGTQAWFNRVVLSQRILVWFGLISFPLYLWHWPLLAFARIVESETPSRHIRIIAVFISVLLAWLTYQLFEKPIRFGNNGKTKTIVLFILMAIVSFVGYNTYDHDGLEFREPVKHLQHINYQLSGIDIRYRENEICNKRYPFQHRDEYKTFFCVQNKDENPTLLLLGNSFANHHYYGLIKNSKFIRNTIISIGNCDPAWASDEPDGRVDECVSHKGIDQQRLIDGIIENSRSIKFAILDGLKEKAKGKEGIMPVSDSKYIWLLRKRIDFLESHSIKVIVFVPHFRLPYSPRGCFARPFAIPKNSCEFSASDGDAYLKDFQPIMDEIKKSNPNVLFFNQNSSFCDKEKCVLVRNGLPLFRDSHFSEFGSSEMAKTFSDWAALNVPELLSPP
jgi:peptidoglycan/LPS O-acetylase OafA/YrhL